MSADLRLLFVTAGADLGGLARLAADLAAEQERGVQVRSLVIQDLGLGRLAPSEARRQLSWADIVLYDVREGREALTLLRAERERSLDKCFVPLAGGPREALALCRMGSLDLSPLVRRGPAPPVDLRAIQPLTRLVEGLGTLVPVGALRDARNQSRVVRYWNAGGERNLRSLLRLVLREYGGGLGPGPEPPDERPPCRLEHPLTGAMPPSVRAWIRAFPPNPDLPWVGLLYYGSGRREASAAAAAALMRAFEGRANVLALASDGVHTAAALRRVLDEPDCPCMDALVSLLWYRLGGGPLGWDPAAALATLQRLDVPLLAPAALHTTERAGWLTGPGALGAEESGAAIVGPEADGALPCPAALALETAEERGLRSGRPVVLQEGIARAAEVTLAWARLRRTPRAERRIALLVAGDPADSGGAGLDPTLDLGASLGELCGALAATGYDLGERWQDALGQVLATPEAARERWFDEDHAQTWGHLPPGVVATPAGREALAGGEPGVAIPGRWFGNVFVGLQPPAAIAGAVDDRTAALYGHLQRREVHALVHLGSGAGLGQVPGKQVALSGACAPDWLLGCIPHIQVGGVADPATLGLARRRSRAVCVTHHPAALADAPLDGESAALAVELERIARPGPAAGGRHAALGRVLERATGLGLPAEDAAALSATLADLGRLPVVMGLRVLGSPRDGTGLLPALRALAHRPIGGEALNDLALREAGEDGAEARLDEWLCVLLATGRLPRDMARRLATPDAVEETFAEYAAGFMECDEIAAVLRALDGRWIAPGPLGDPRRDPAALPVGRNGHLVPPAVLPDDSACAWGGQAGASLLSGHRQATGMHLRSALVVLRGDPTARTGGESLALALHLLGARALHPAGERLVLEPVADPGHPRVDVTFVLDAAFRDLYPEVVQALDRLARRLAALDEPDVTNPLRARVEAEAATLGASLSGARVFAPGPGSYGPASPRRIAGAGEAFTAAMGFAWGDRLPGTPAGAAWARALGRTEMVVFPVAGPDRRLLDLPEAVSVLAGAVLAVARARGGPPRCVVCDGDVRALRSAPEAAAVSALRGLLSPAWLEALLAHSGQATRHVATRVARLCDLEEALGLPLGLRHAARARLVDDAATFARLVADDPIAAHALAWRLGETAEATDGAGR